MFIKQLYTGCLSEAAYYIEDNGEAAIVDPLRDIDVYLELAAERKTTIKYIFTPILSAGTLILQRRQMPK
jgi:glyoxylase-like metal-dependent hydrolase (beta-lactamase superfamily II)